MLVNSKLMNISFCSIEKELEHILEANKEHVRDGTAAGVEHKHTTYVTTSSVQVSLFIF